MARRLTKQAPKEYLLADGRTITPSFLHGDKWKMSGGVLTERLCVRHRKFLPVEQFSRNRTTLKPYCKECAKKEWMVQYAKRNVPPLQYVEYHIIKGTSGDELICKNCGEQKNISKFRTATTPATRVCIACQNAKREANRVRRRIRKAFGEDSPEYLLAKNEKRDYYLKALCKMLGIPTRGRVLPPSNWKIRRILPALLTDTERRESALEERVQRTLKTVQKRCARDYAVEVYPLRPV